MHGLIQSQAHAEAARKLSAARKAQREGVPGAEELVAAAHKECRKALQEYIDPFKRYRVW